MKSGNGNEKVGIPTFEFSAGRRQCCLVAIEYCVLSVLKAKFYSARAEIGGRTRGQVHTPAIYGFYIWRFGAQNLHFICPAGAAEQLLVG